MSQSIVLGPDDPVKLVSADDRDLTIMYERTTYLLAAGATAYWAWKIACHFLGDPTLHDTPVLDNATQEHLRIKRQNGIPGSLDITPEEWEKVRPKVAVSTMEGQPIKMVAEGLEDQPDFSIGYTPDDMKMRIAQLEAQINSLVANTQEEGAVIVTETAPGEEQITDMSKLPTDGGTPRSARRRT